MNVKRYDRSFYRIWNEFLVNSKNRHFFFDRDYLSYHQGKLTDHSLLIFDEDDKLTALFPANIENTTLYSHGGLTFGGFVFKEKITTKKTIDIFKSVKEYLKERRVEKVYYKALPYIHHIKPSQEDLYALFLQKATLVKRDISLVIDLNQKIRYSNGRKWSVKRAQKENFSINRSYDFDSFWKLLEINLENRHNSTPTHSVEEIKYLSSKFPNNIKLYTLTKENTLVCGGVTYENSTVTHLQYVANSPYGKELGALDLLIDRLIRMSKEDKRYFSFGTSSRKKDNKLNYGLIDQKERFGASCVAYDHYEWKIS